MLPIIFGLCSAATWGAGDFVGGLASRKASALMVVFFADIIALGFLLAALGFVPEALPSPRNLVLCTVAGMLASVGLAILYHVMSAGQMSVAASVSGLVAAIIPVAVGVLMDGLPTLPQGVGFGAALAAVWLITQEDGSLKPQLERLSDLRLPFLAGLTFGAYFVVLNFATKETAILPMIATRVGGIIALLMVGLWRRESFKISAETWKLVPFNSLFDMGGNWFYVLAGQAGRMDVAAVLSALYPGFTVMLAWSLLKEKISRTQSVGIVCALAAIALMTV